VVEDGVTGFLCHDDQAMVEAVDKLASLEREDCRASAEGYFATERMVADHVALYERVLAARS
jgi:glycosyltransferase involved in cell wall biosynthesis